MRNAFVINIAKNDDLERIITFLSQPDIEKGFCKPFSERNVSIPERVRSKFKQGVWVFAEIDCQIVSCVAIIPEGKGVSFSTFACKSNVGCKLAGAGVWEKSLKLATEISKASYIEIDSWAGNQFINRFLTKRGFKKVRTFSDPDKRPVAVKSVLYRMAVR